MFFFSIGGQVFTNRGMDGFGHFVHTLNDEKYYILPLQLHCDLVRALRRERWCRCLSPHTVRMGGRQTGWLISTIIISYHMYCTVLL